MRRPMAGLLALALLAASCSSTPPPEKAGTGIPAPGAAAGTATVSPVACRVGPDDGPVLGDRGIGGTGAASGSTRTADRGIGGTGAASGAARSADRGIGGTGIIGVVTGFASVCLDGREVGLGDTVPVSVDGEPASAAALRAGQLAAVGASGPGTALQARSVAVRHEVSGPVEAIEADSTLRVAGQRVAASGDTWGERAPRPGEWVAVSGLRRADGVIVATRIDRRAPGGLVTVHGLLLAGPDGTLRIGDLEVRPAAGIPVAAPGQYATAFGRYRDGGVLLAEDVAPDVLAENPAAYFGGSVGVVIVEAYASIGEGRVRFGHGREFPASPNLGPFAPGRAIVELERRGAGAFVATAVREGGSGRLGGRGGAGLQPGGVPGSVPRSGPAGGPIGARGGLGPGSGPDASPRGQAPSVPAPSRAFEPAPVPNRSFDLGRPGFGGSGSRPGTGGAARGNRSNAGPSGTGQPGFRPGAGFGSGGPGGRGGGDR
jgi:hypothetical protein